MKKEENEKEVAKELYGISLDLATNETEVFPVNELPQNHAFGQYVSHRTGTKDQMENLKASLIQSNLSKLRRIHHG